MSLQLGIRTSLAKVPNIDHGIPPKFPIRPLKCLHPGFRNQAWLESMPPLGQILEVVVMTMIDDLKGDGDLMVFNTKKGAGGEAKKKGRGASQYPCTKWGGCVPPYRHAKTMPIGSGGSREGR